jgi:16S rRNA (guanine966-N2)-methyltransferase
VREAWFSIIGDVSGKKVLELYAGSGALGIEALSRGAHSCVFVESWTAAVASIKSNLSALELSQAARVMVLPVERSASALASQGPFDLVLADPPWTEMERAAEALGHLFKTPLLAEEGLIVLGHPRDFILNLPHEAGVSCLDRRAWGDSGASIFSASKHSDK